MLKACKYTVTPRNGREEMLSHRSIGIHGRKNK